MNNKQQIQKLRDNAELAWASYGYFHLVGKKLDKKDERIKNSPRKYNLAITHTDILDMTYYGYKAVESNPHKQDDEIKVGILKGDMTPTQAKRFFERYDLLNHCPNTSSGFSATLFGEKRKQIDSKTKEKSYIATYGYINYTLAIRGTEMNSFKDLFVADVSLAAGSTPKAQYDDMIHFYESCVRDYPQIIKEKDSLTLTRHSIGGALAQLFTFSFATAESASIIKALYI